MLKLGLISSTLAAREGEKKSDFIQILSVSLTASNFITTIKSGEPNICTFQAFKRVSWKPAHWHNSLKNLRETRPLPDFANSWTIINEWSQVEWGRYNKKLEEYLATQCCENSYQAFQQFSSCLNFCCSNSRYPQYLSNQTEQTKMQSLKWLNWEKERFSTNYFWSLAMLKSPATSQDKFEVWISSDPSKEPSFFLVYSPHKQ